VRKFKNIVIVLVVLGLLCASVYFYLNSKTSVITNLSDFYLNEKLSISSSTRSGDCQSTKIINGILFCIKNQIGDFSFKINSASAVQKIIKTFDVDLSGVQRIDVVVTSEPQDWYQQSSEKDPTKILASVGRMRQGANATLYLQVNNDLLNRRGDNWQAILQADYSSLFSKALVVINNTDGLTRIPDQKLNEYSVQNYPILNQNQSDFPILIETGST